jgi:tetratricopeptide (TPR) repeat protein
VTSAVGYDCSFRRAFRAALEPGFETMHVVWPLLPLVYLLSAASLHVRSQDEDLTAKSRVGKELMAAGRYGEAVPVYRELVKAVPDNPGLLLNLGMALHLAGQDAEAVPQFEAALRLQPDSLPAALFLGAANLRLRRMEASVGPLQKALRLQPDNRDARSMLVEALLGLERYGQAEPHVRRLAELAPSDPATWFNLGKTYEVLAERAFDALLRRDPESAFALALVADARLKQDQRNAAFHLYRQAIERAPKLRGLHAAVAGIYRDTGHPDWAVLEEEKEKRLPRPDCARAAMECGFSAGKYRHVVTTASRLKSPEASYWLARAYNELAAQAFSRLTALSPSAESHQWMAEIRRNERRYRESAEQWRQAIAVAPADRRLRTELAVTLRLARDLPEAQKVLEELVQAEPDAPEPSYLLGDVLLAQDQPERAIRFLEKAVRGESGHLHAHGALGRAYALVGRTADAIPHLEQALPADADGSLRYQLARCYQASGQAEQARKVLADYEEFRKAVQADSEAPDQAPAITPP